MENLAGHDSVNRKLGLEMKGLNTENSANRRDDAQKELKYDSVEYSLSKSRIPNAMNFLLTTPKDDTSDTRFDLHY